MKGRILIIVAITLFLYTGNSRAQNVNSISYYSESSVKTEKLNFHSRKQAVALNEKIEKLLADKSVVKSQWKGFDRLDFNFNGRNAWIVCPKKPLSDNPWVWNARFPDWHTEMDSILLNEGFFITYINTDELIGSPRAVEVWNTYYDYLITQIQFNHKVALEGVSRGGLYVYNWAKVNPGKVICIYCEGPVCDISSWPGGYKKGKRSDADWELVKKMYGFATDSAAIAFRDNPVDNLDSLAKSAVPILHMVGINDEVVPTDVNTMILVERYIKLGGPAIVIPCTKGVEPEGHHYKIETPRRAADFIKYCYGI